MIKFSGKTHPGYREGENEDSIGWDTALSLWLVADGMGGHASGQLASTIARNKTLEAFSERPADDSILAAHRAIKEQASEQLEHKGMGSTIVAAHVDDRTLHVHWVGDSRLYLFRQGVLKQVSVDHSFIELLKEKVEMTEEEIRNHPQKNLVTQTLGHEDPTPSLRTVPLRKGDRLLLCSDGLTDYVADADIEATLKKGDDLDEVTHQLIDQALSVGGKDNVSVIVLDYLGESSPDVVEENQDSQSSLAPVIAGVLAALLVAAALVYWLSN